MSAPREVWVDDPAPGGYVCSECGVPVESEPCLIHGPSAVERVLAEFEALHPAVPRLMWAEDCEDPGHVHSEDDNGDPVCRACPVQGRACGLCKDYEGDGVDWPCEHGLLIKRLRDTYVTPAEGSAS